MNNTFSLNRFTKLFQQQYQLSGKSLMLAIASIFIGYTAVLLVFTFNNSHISNVEWIPFFVILNGMIALSFAAYAFPAFRSKEKTFDYLLLPGSVMEKFTFNVLVRIIAPWIVLPVIFYISSRLATELALWYYPSSSIESVNLFGLLEQIDGRKTHLLTTTTVLTVLLHQSVLFAGATVFVKQPLIKTLVSLGIAAAITMLYFYLITTWAGVFENNRMPWLAKYSNNTNGVYIAIVIESLLLITTWAYAFFKVKEKEIV